MAYGSHDNKLNLEIGAILNTTKVERTLKDLDAKVIKTKDYTINVKTGDGFTKAVKTVNTLKDAYGNLYQQVKIVNAENGKPIKGVKPNEIKSITEATQSIQNLTTETHKWVDSKGAIQNWSTTVDSSGRTVSTRIKQVVDDIGNVTTTTQKLVSEGAGKPFHKMGEDIVKVSELLQETTTSTNTSFGKITDTVNGVTKTFDGTITTIKKMSSNGEELTTVISKYTNDMGQAVERTEQFDKMGNKVATTMRKISEATDTKKATFIDKEGNKTITEYSNGVATLRTEIKTYTDEVGNLITQTDKYDAQTNQLISTHQDLKRNIQEEVKEDNKRLEQLNNLITKINEQTEAQKRLQNALVSTTTKKTKGTTTQFGDSSGQEYEALITTIERVDKEGQKTIKTIYEFTNAQGELVKQTRITDQYLNKIAEDTIEVSQALERTTKVTNDVSSIHKYVDSIGRLVTETVSYNEQGEKIVKTVIEEQKGLGQLTTTTKVLNETTGQLISTNIQLVNDETKVEKTLDNTSNSVKKTSNNLKELNTTTERANHGVKNLGWTLGDAISRLSNFYIASLPIRAVQTAITETISTVKDFDSALIEFRKVSDLAGDSLVDYTAKLAKMGEVTGSTMQAMVEASTEFRKSGFSDEDSAQLASIAEKYRNIADEEISAGESASFIIAQMKAFNIEADQAEHIIDSVNEVANNFSVSSADLAKNLGNMSEIMAINNVSMEQQIGMLTGVTEITRNASSASRGLVMISSRLTQVLDDSSSTGKKLTKVYEDLGIELKDENGQLRSHYDILGDLAGQWDNLSENEQKYIALTSAGARQQQNFVALMENWNQVAKATATAYESIGSAQRENEKVMDSIAKKVEILKSEFQQLVIGKGGLQDFAKTILDIGIAILKFVNSDIGKLVITLVSLEAAIYGVSKAWAALKIAGQTKIIASAIASLITGEVTLSQVTSVLTAEFLKNAAAFLTTPMGQATVFVAFMAALVAVTYRWATSIDRATKKLKKLSDQADETESEIENLKNSLHEIRESIDKVNAKKLEITDDEQLKKLKRETKELENQELVLKNQVALAQQKLELEHRDEAKQAKKTYDTKQISSYKTVSTGVNDTDPTAMGSGAGSTTTTYAQTTAIEELNLATEALKKNTEERNRNIRLAELEARQNGTNTEAYAKYQKQISLASDEIEKAQKVGQKNAETLNTVRDSLSSVGDEYSEDIEKIDNSTEAFLNASNASSETKDNIYGIKDALSEENDALDENAEELSEEEIALQMLADAHNVAIEDLKEWAKELGISEEALVNYADSIGLSVEKAYEFQTQLKSWNEQIDLLQSSFDTLNSAVEEYNNSQELSLDTVQALLNLDPQYLRCLDEESGKLVLNEQKITDKVNALIEERKSIATNIAYERLRALEIGESSEAEVDHKAKTESNTEAINRETDAILKNANAYARKIKIESQGKKGAEAEKIVADLEKELAILDKIGNSYSSISSKSSKAGSAGKSGAKSAANAQKELNKELEETIKKYEQVIKYISKRYDREIKKLKDAEKDELNEEEKVIKAKEKEKDTTLKSIEKEIKALEKQKDALKEQKELLDDRKEALKNEEDAIVDNVQTQIDALKDLKDARKDYWDAQIDALKKANEELKDNLELQEKLDALEKAKNTKVKIYKEGQGFVYDVDKTAVAEAQKALDEYLSQKAYEDELERLENLRDAEVKNYDDRIKALEDYKNNVEKIYESKIKVIEKDIDALEKQMDALDKNKDAIEEHKDAVQEALEAEIDALNEHKDATQESYETQIDVWEKLKEGFEDLVDQYEEQQNKLLFEQLTGIKDENNNWLTRLDNLAVFVKKYNELKSQLDTGNTNVSNDASFKSGSTSGGGSYNSGGNNTTTTTSTANTRKGVQTVTTGKYAGISSVGSSGAITKQIAYVGDSKVGNSGVVTIGKKVLGRTYASGTPSVKQDEIAIVGENPNKEIVIGSKINNGELMSLGKGTGVVNADSSKTLASMLNQVGQFGASGFGSGNGTLNNNINNDSLVVNGVTIQGSNIKDPETFVNGLLNLKAEALQRAYKHR